MHVEPPVRLFDAEIKERGEKKTEWKETTREVWVR